VDSFKTAQHLQQRAAQMGFDWPNIAFVLDKVEEELAELREAIIDKNPINQAEELGDLLFTLVNLARHLQLDAENMLNNANDKFKRRFAFIEQTLQKSGKPMENCSLDSLEKLWQQAKQQEKISFTDS